MPQKLIDPYGRVISYLRLSVTERCNLSCIYCRSNPLECGKGQGKEMLTVDDCLNIGQAAVELGMTRIRLTGGTVGAPRYFKDYYRFISHSGPKIFPYNQRNLSR